MAFITNLESPLDIKVSFEKLIGKYKSILSGDNALFKHTSELILKFVENNPILTTEFTSLDDLIKHQEQIRFLLQDIFHPALTHNEIKSANVPFHNYTLITTERYKSIFANKTELELQIKNMDESNWYIIGSSIILKACYNYDINFKRPFFYEFKDEKGVKRYYKILYNADFVDITPKKNAPEITEDDYKLLLDNFENIELWREKFPPNSYDFKGFIISNIVDVTDDQSISNIKTALIGEDKRQDENFIKSFQDVFRSLLGLDNIKVGFSIYNKDNDTFERVYGNGMNSYLINNLKVSNCRNSLCTWSYNRLLVERKYFSISDVRKAYDNDGHGKPHIEILQKQGIESAIFAPIANNEDLMGILEIVSKKPYELNSINAQKLVDVMPFIISAVERSKSDEENLIKAIIQKECTSIHSSVHWRFEQEAKEYIKDQLMGIEPTFKSISFDNIYPLFGQIDIKSSSEARNTATINDLNLQLQDLKLIFQSAFRVENLPIYENTLFQIKKYLGSLNEFFQVDSEQQINSFIQNDINPILHHLKRFEPLRKSIETYFNKIDVKTNSFYSYRKDYDDTISSINKSMSTILDEKQVEAQIMYPHYYERFKTDGVEHNIYIGKSLNKEGYYNDIYLYNLRLWQLQVMCEMENTYYQMQSKYKVKLDAASMILVFSQPLSISFRMDEKQFDVDGTYNARYEIVKKRVDKAHIKGTNERITQKGKITIIYSQKQDEEEYLNYIKFLQSKRYLDQEIEILELQDLQAVSGLKAIRVKILYHKNQKDKVMYTYEDLMNTLK